MSVHPDITACSRQCLERLLDGTATASDRVLLRASVDTPIQHNPLECTQCIHEAATALPPLVMICWDPFKQSIYASTDAGPAQGERAAHILLDQFKRYPGAAELARRLSNTIGKTDSSNAREVLIALAGAICRIVDKAHEGTL